MTVRFRHDHACCGRAHGVGHEQAHEGGGAGSAGRPFAFASSPRHFERDRPFAIEHIALDLALDFPKKSVRGSATLDARGASTRTPTSVELDAVGVHDRGASPSTGSAAKYTYDGAPARRRRAAAASSTARSSSATRPRRARASTSSSPTSTCPSRPRQVWTQCQDEDARHIFPCHDKPHVKMTTEAARHACPRAGPRSRTASSSSERTSHGRSRDVPLEDERAAPELPRHARRRRVRGLRRSRTLEPRRLDVRARCRSPTSSRRAARRTGGARFGAHAGDDRATSPSSPACRTRGTSTRRSWSATSSSAAWRTPPPRRCTSTSCSTSAPRSTSRATTSSRTSSRTSGSATTSRAATGRTAGSTRASPRSWSTSGARTHLGRDEYDYGVKDDLDAYLGEAHGRYRRPIVCQDYDAPIDLFDRHLYEKGGLVLHMLRRELGDALFWKGVAALPRRATRAASSRRAISCARSRRSAGGASGASSSSGCTGPATPSSRSTSSWDDGVLTVRREADADARRDGVPERRSTCRSSSSIVDARGRDAPRERATRRSARVRQLRAPVRGAARASSSSIPSMRILGDVKVKAPRRHAARAARRGADRRAADGSRRRRSRKSDDPPSPSRRSRRALGDEEEFWGVRAECADALGRIRAREAFEVLAASTYDRAPEGAPRRRRRARALPHARPPSRRSKPRALRDESYLVEAEAARALGKTRQPAAFDVLVDVIDRPSWADVIARGRDRRPRRAARRARAAASLSRARATGIPRACVAPRRSRSRSSSTRPPRARAPRGSARRRRPDPAHRRGARARRSRRRAVARRAARARRGRSRSARAPSHPRGRPRSRRRAEADRAAQGGCGETPERAARPEGARSVALEARLKESASARKSAGEPCGRSRAAAPKPNEGDGARRRRRSAADGRGAEVS